MANAGTERTTAGRPVNNDIYEDYGDRWYTAYDDPIALLRAESRTKLPWVLERLAREVPRGGTVLDVGCGAGFLSNALAKEGFAVTGVDLSGESLRVAARHDETSSVRYLPADAMKLPFADASFDSVTAMDFLEHVEDPASVIAEIGRVLKPGGAFFFHTFNRNPLSYLMIIKAVEWFVANTPKDMHVLRLFVKPSEVRAACERAAMDVREVVGIRPCFSSIPLRNYFSGIVPEGMRFKLTRSTLLSYIGWAKKAALQ